MMNLDAKIKTQNTKKQGLISFLVAKQKGENNFIGVCLTFNIVQEDNDPERLLRSLQESAKLHLETVLEKNLPDELLNRPAPKKYWKIYFESKEMIRKEKEMALTTSIPYPDFVDALSANSVC